MKIVNRILNANKGRDPERLALKYSAMRSNAFAFLRGTNHLFYDRLPKSGICKSAPLTWCCGDLHLENFGSYKGDNRLVYFDINDFDEAALAPPSWELSRMITSIMVSAHSFDISTENAKKLSEQFIESYAEALLTGKARWVERETTQGMVRELLEQLRQRTRVDFLNTRTQKQHKLRHFILDGKKSLPVSEAQRTEVTRFMERFASTQPHPEFYKVLDVARRIAGTGSLGVERYAILVEGKGSPDQNYLLDLKQARPSSMAKHLTTIQPAWNNEAERVVTLQRRMQAVSMAFLYPEVIGTRSYVLQALQPFEDRVPLAKYHRHIDSLTGVVQVMGQCVAWAQLRSSGRQGSAIADELIDFAERKKWRFKLLELAYELSNQVKEDWQTYSESYDDGAFQVI
ncbi:DUF2252 domain-containing protein [Methylomicrobium sp. Wu6]|uniref:DUF2252 domain-containing protein n=1 Tax=Methylomicrobium sp. Wu6 TaxID=3107928 RepID=UPI002DD61F14|nr:DUF2252 domain-containing protein [Methylomicrobium sp. Wu6]MEC4750462.1 DUF2252 domain-containing protein [Methylomicrobium sp. Wu6]